MQRELIAAAALVLVASTSFAARDVLEGFEGGGDSGATPWTLSTMSKAFSSVVGSPTIEANTGLSGLDSGDDFSLRINPASGGTEYVVTSVTATADGTVHLEFCLRAAPATGTNREVVSFYSATTSSKQCFLMAEAESPGVRLRVYFHDTGLECVGSLDNGTNCTDTTVCREVNPGAASCAPANFAQSSTVLQVGTCSEVAVTTDTTLTDPGNVQCGLLVNGKLQGNQTRAQGVCTGGLHPGEACAKSTDCSQTTEGDAAGTCSVTTLGNTSEIRWGVTDTNTGAIDYSIDNLAHEGSVNTGLFFRLADLHPNGSPSGGDGASDNQGCTGTSPANDYQCVQDTISGTSGHTNETNYVQIQGTDLDLFQLQDVTLGTGESIRPDAMVGFNASLRETAANGNSKPIRFGVSNGTTTRYASTFDPNGYGTSYWSSPTSLFSSDWSSASWNLTDINALDFALDAQSTNSSGFRVRVTDAWAEVEVTRPTPTPATVVMTDPTGDTKNTVCVFGTSLVNDQALYTALAAQLDGADNIYDYGNEGTKLGMLWPGSASCVNSALAGGNPTCWKQQVYKGTTGAICDYVFFLWDGANDYGTAPSAPTDGYCFAPATPTPGAPTPTPGGPATPTPDTIQGSTCSIPAGAVDLASFTSYCNNPGFFGVFCGLGANPATACGTPIAGGTAQCNLTGAGATICVPAAKNANGCPQGLCAQRTTESTFQDYLGKILDAMDAYGVAHGTKFIAILPWRTWETNAADTATFTCRFTNVRDDLRASRGYWEHEAARRSWMTIDPDGAMQNRCDNHRVACCERDALHLSVDPTYGLFSSSQGCPNPMQTTGNQVLADLMTHCLTGTSDTYASCGNL